MLAMTWHLLAAPLLLKSVEAVACPICLGLGPAIDRGAARRRPGGRAGGALGTVFAATVTNAFLKASFAGTGDARIAGNATNVVLASPVGLGGRGLLPAGPVLAPEQTARHDRRCLRRGPRGAISTSP